MANNYHSRKDQRTREYWQAHGRKLITCSACMGSGVYDNVGSPPCGCCDGTGKTKQPLPLPPQEAPHWRDKLKRAQEISKLKKLNR
jgi:hypothetical protein